MTRKQFFMTMVGLSAGKQAAGTQKKPLSKTNLLYELGQLPTVHITMLSGDTVIFYADTQKWVVDIP